METTLPIRRWRSGEFDKMFEIGLLAPRGYELLDGVVYNTQGFAKRWSVYDFDRMVEGGVITPEERAELASGAVFEPRSFRPLHAWAKAKVTSLLWKVLGDDESLFVSPTGYVLLDDETMVAPEVFVLTREAHENIDAWPRARDVPLITEIVDPLYSTLLQIKRRIYAAHGITELWFIDPPNSTVTVHASPANGAYRTVHEYREGEAWVSNALLGAQVSVHAVVGRKR